MSSSQRVLSAEQTEEFYHDLFVAGQVAAFQELLGPRLLPGDCAVDIGGGCGYFARALQAATDVTVRVIDTDTHSISACRTAGLQAQQGDALNPRIRGDESIATFNMVLHHLVGSSARETRRFQIDALRAWAPQVRLAFVNEYVYESYVIAGLSGWIMWMVTSSRLLSAVARVVARFVPSLRANTLGVGVRFRPVSEWAALFREAGFEVVDRKPGLVEPVSVARRLLFIRQARRDSFLLQPIQSRRQEAAI